MELRTVLRVAKRWWWLGALPVVIVALYLALSFTPPAPAYQVVLRFTAGSAPAPALSADYDRYYAWLSSEYIANGLADLAVTSGFGQVVADELAAQNVKVSPQAIQSAIATDNAQSILVVYLTWPDPEQAVTIAETVGRALLDAGPTYYPQMDEVGSVARLADVPVAVPLPASLRAQLLGPALRMAIAAAVGAGLILLAHYVDPWVRDQEELAAVGLRVLAIVPRHSDQRP